MSGLNINNIDTSRDQYFDYGDYISRRHGDRYYNLGYAIYKGVISVSYTHLTLPTICSV